MSANMPGTSPTHGEADQHDPIRVDFVSLLDRFDDFQHVDFTSVFPADAVTAERVNDDRAARRDLARPRRPLLEEVQIGIVVAAAMQPDIERTGLVEIMVL